MLGLATKKEINGLREVVRAQAIAIGGLEEQITELQAKKQCARTMFSAREGPDLRTSKDFPSEGREL